MTTQPPLFVLPETPTPADWHTLAAAAIDQLATTGGPFTADDVRKLLPPGMVDPGPGAMGAAFTAARHRHRIRVVGWDRPWRGTRHGNMNRVWQAA